MTPELARHIQQQTRQNGLANAFFNGAIAWWLLRDVESLSWWGPHSFGVDILATAFLLPLIVALILIPMTRRKRAARKIPSIAPDVASGLAKLATSFPRSLLISALLFGLIGVLVLAAPTLAIFHWLGIDSIGPAQYSIFKALWAGGMAFLLAGPMIIIGAREHVA